MKRTKDSDIITGRIPVVSKLAYGLGDASTTLLRIVIMTYLAYFYTDVAKLNPLAVGTMMLVTQIINLISAPVIGLMVDATHTRKGKARPWFAGVAVPLGLFGALCFFTPDLSPAWRLAFAYISYNGYNICNNALHIPLGAILPNMSTDSNERQSANSWRMTIGQIAGAMASLITVPLVTFFGQGNERLGYSSTTILYGIFAIVCCLFCYFVIHENVNPEDRAERHGKKRENPFANLGALRNNFPLFALLVADFFNSLYTTIHSAGMMYYLKYQVHNTNLMPTLSVLTYLSVIVIALVPRLNKRYSKRSIFAAGLIAAIIARVIIMAVPSNVVVLYAGMIINGLSTGCGLALMYTMAADCIDYGECRNGTRAQGVTYSLSSMLEGIATGVGGALVGYVLNWGGYVADAEAQTASAMISINSIFLYIPIACCAIMLIALAFYNLDSKLPEVTKVLNERHASRQTAVQTD
ncbi:MFS transporter [Actinomyces glycerinitolerans]|uniref:Mfs/sugar transport protein n=1 Tax=Actinomyces glycerinitolerans TaxID=1892869 RepID=A0A1M4RXU8_9ACTO|nr:glycoside-pentoside-hexuronide (GPH):cation symporter [Actinomyces glycerinitolerans]SHE24803.1 mfs/sugar transport protein [Actinomyces glycerinitolerans]